MKKIGVLFLGRGTWTKSGVGQVAISILGCSVLSGFWLGCNVQEKQSSHVFLPRLKCTEEGRTKQEKKLEVQNCVQLGFQYPEALHHFVKETMKLRSNMMHPCGKLILLEGVEVKATFFCLLSFQGCTRSIWRFPGQASNQSFSHWPTPEPQQRQIRAASATYTHSSQPRWILNSLSEARDRTCNFTVPSWICFSCTATGTPLPCFYDGKKYRYILDQNIKFTHF